MKVSLKSPKKKLNYGKQTILNFTDEILEMRSSSFHK